MRRFIHSFLSISATALMVSAGLLHAQQAGAQQPGAQQTGAQLTGGQQTGGQQTGARQSSPPRLQKLGVPASQAKTIATKLSIQYRDVPGVQISPDANNQQLVIMAPEPTQRTIAKDVKAMLASHAQPPSASAGPMRFGLTYITWREFEDNLRRLVGGTLPITTSRNGERAAFQLTAAPLQGTTIEVDRRNNLVTVIAPKPTVTGWQRMIGMLDQVPARGADVTELMRIENAEPAPIQRALRLLKELENHQGAEVAAAPIGANSPFRNAVFQQNAAGGQTAEGGDDPADPLGDDEGGAGVIGDTQIQFVPELGTIIIRGAKRDVERVMEVIKQIEEQSKITKPDVEVVELQHTDANAVTVLLEQLYEDVLSARQGEVSITSLDSPNALLLIGRTEAINGLKELISKIDQPVAESSRLRVFRLQNASAVDAEQTIRDFFTDRPGSSDDLRPGVGPRVRVLADYRTNSLIISAAPRDMIEVTRLINDLDVQEISAQNQIKIFPLNNAVADDLAPVIQSAINGEAEGASDNVTTPSTTLSIVALDAENAEVLDSGILAGAVVTAEPGANAIVVRAPAASMPLIGELIRQLDKVPGIESLVKVFTIENGDALQLTTALQTLFGDDASTLGTSVGAGNLPSSTAAGESSLVPLRFSTDQRTNSIVASGSAEDLDVVESILLRLDSEGFAERITEVIWLRHQAAADVATAIQTYVQQRTQTVNTIQQFQQGLGPFDLPDRDLIVVAEPVSNSVLLSVSPRLYEDVRRLIDKLDRRPPMVLIKVLLAEVQLEDTFEIGGEVGLQDSLLFDRGVASAPFVGAQTDPTSISNPGFNFNNSGTPNLNLLSPDTLAASGVSTFGVGTASSLGYGGFVLSAASDSVNLLLRTLQDANRLQILSRPQIMTMDNTEGFVQVGSLVARVTDFVNNGVSGTQLVTDDVEVGLIMNVRPRVGADGLIVMDIDATRSEIDNQRGTPLPTGIPGEVVTIPNIRITTAQSVVAAYSGQTVVFGGLIQKTRSNISRRVPYVADLPLVGHFFKFDQEFEQRSELLVIMTPMLITGEHDLDYVKETESSRMSWCLADVVEAHGDVGLSGGYGLWGPAVGHTIYPDMQPTIDDVIIHESASNDGANAPQVQAMQQSTTIQSGNPFVAPQSTQQQPSPTVQGAVINHMQDNGVLAPPQGRSSNLPAPVAVPQALVAPAQEGDVSQSSYRGESAGSTSTNSNAATQQASWSDVLKRRYAEKQGAATQRSGEPRKPTRLGSSDEMLTSE